MSEGADLLRAFDDVLCSPLDHLEELGTIPREVTCQNNWSLMSRRAEIFWMDLCDKLTPKP